MRFFMAVLAYIMLSSDSFAACIAGYYGDMSVPSPGARCDSGKYTSNNLYLDNTYAGIERGHWQATWNGIGTAYGISSCNDVEGTKNSTTGSSSSFNTTSMTGPNCWCKITGWTPYNGSYQDMTSDWVYQDYCYSQSDCNGWCVGYCSSMARVALVNAMFSAAKTKCTACPGGGTSVAGATLVTQCYKAASSNFTDSIGTYHFSSDCYYSE